MWQVNPINETGRRRHCNKKTFNLKNKNEVKDLGAIKRLNS